MSARYAPWAAFAVALVLSSCGGGGSGPNPPPPPPPTPANLAKQTGDNQSAEPGQPVPVAPSVRVTSASGAPVSGVSVTFAVASGAGTVTGATPVTGADGVAAVGSWVLGSMGSNTLTATVTASGIAGNPVTFAATGQLSDFSPTSNTTLTGTRNFVNVNIPAGVTVTATGDLVLHATGTITIAGTLSGSCVAETVTADGSLSVSGTVSSVCSGALPATVPAINLIGKGGYSFSGAARVTASGNVTITDDPTATDADFVPPFGDPFSQLR